MSEVTSSQNVNSSNNVTGGGVDYDSGPYTVTFTAGDTSASVSVPINDDDILEDDEDFTLTIMSGTLPDGVTRDGAGQTIITLVDDEGEVILTVAIIYSLTCLNCFVYNTC